METPISPKVIVSVIVGIVLTALVSNVSAITPDMLDFLGPWKLFVFGSLITALMGLAAWWKTDPLRVVPASTGPAPTVEAAAAGVLTAKQTSLAATSVDPAAPVSFASTQAKVDSLPEPVEVTPVFTPPAA
jgi:hypothetical protein